jgi:hypothetical protein
MIDRRQVQLAIPIVVTFISPLIAKYGFTADQATTTLNAWLAFGFDYAIPAASWAWHLYLTSRDQRLKAAAVTPGVLHLAMDTQTAADALAEKTAAGKPVNDNIIGPKELPVITEALPDVKAVVMNSEALAAAIPNPNIVGPSRLVPAPLKSAS